MAGDDEATIEQVVTTDDDGVAEDVRLVVVPAR
jgi:hypothetical protein